MKLTTALIDRLQALLEGNAVPSSQMKGAWVDELRREGALMVEVHGARRSYRVASRDTFVAMLPRYNEALADLGSARRMLMADEAPTRAEQAQASGNSKVVTRRTYHGFLVNAITPISATLGGRPITIAPAEGTFTFVYDWQQFSIPADILLVGVENMENFRHPSPTLLRTLLQGERGIMLLSRYPQEQSADMRAWLMSVPNRYVHFGDFDLAGINIFLTEFRAHLGSRASFLIPADICERLAHGSRARYDAQYERFRNLSAPDDTALQRLIDTINHLRRCYDQEGYIESHGLHTEEE